MTNPANSLTMSERDQYRHWLDAAAQSITDYNGSEKALNQLLEPLFAIDAFVKSKNNGRPSAELESRFTREALGNDAPKLQFINDFLQAASDAQTRRLHAANGYEGVLSLLEQGGGVVKRYGGTFIQTDEGQINAPSSIASKPMEQKLQPRLAMLVQHLKDEGIYTDDIIAYACKPDPTMVRKQPYIVLQIPRLDKEIAVCDQVGEITFVSNKILGPDVWANLTKKQLEARPEITSVRFTEQKEWWQRLHAVLTETQNAAQTKKIDVEQFAGGKPPLDIDLIKQSIRAHRQETGGWPTTQTSGEVLHGPLAKKETWTGINAALTVGIRSLPGRSSLAKLNAEVSEEYHLDYVNHLKQEPLNPETIKASILAHRREKGEWPTQTSGEVRYGPLAEKERWGGN